VWVVSYASGQLAQPRAARYGRSWKLWPVSLIAAVSLAAAPPLATASSTPPQSVAVGFRAPTNVKNAIRFQSSLIPKAPRVVVADTVAATVLNTSVGRVYLWVAPSVGDTSCAYIQIVAADRPGHRPNLSGGCTVVGSGVAVGTSAVRVRGQLHWFIEGVVGIKGARTLDVQFTNGISERLRVADDYVLAESSADATPERLTVRGANGRFLAERHIG
jgi:hypothetical protein